MEQVTEAATLLDRIDPVRLFDKLLREVDAGRALVGLSAAGPEQRAAALDALALVRDVLDDARDELARLDRDQLAGVVELQPAVEPVQPQPFTTSRTSCACGQLELAGDDELPDAVDDDLVHSGIACTRTEGQL